MKWDAEKYDAVKAPQVDAGRELIALAGVRENDAVLDLGCGTGKLTIELARLAAKGNVVGIDPSEEMLERARAVSAGARNVSLIKAAAEDMGFSERFDLVFSNSALQWVKDQHRALGLTYNSLRKNGRIAFQLPAKNFCVEFFDYIEKAVALLGYERFYYGWQSPWRFPARDDFADMLSRAGFQSIDVSYKDYHLRFSGVPDVVNWWSSAGLRPYLAALPEGAQQHFKEAFAEGFERNRTDKGIEFNFRRLFALAEKS